MSKVSTEEGKAIMEEFEAYTKKWLAEKNLGDEYAIACTQVIRSAEGVQTSTTLEWGGEQKLSTGMGKAVMVSTLRLVKNLAEQAKIKVSSNKPANE
jgi:hypothetical protein